MSPALGVDMVEMTRYIPIDHTVSDFVLCPVYFLIYFINSFIPCVYFLMSITCISLSAVHLIVLPCVPLHSVNRPCLALSYCIIVFLSVYLNYLLWLSFVLPCFCRVPSLCPASMCPSGHFEGGIHLALHKHLSSCCCKGVCGIFHVLWNNKLLKTQKSTFILSLTFTGPSTGGYF